MRDFRDSKGMAKTLRDALAERDVTFTQSESLELISRLFGLANWNVLAAKIERAEREHILAQEPERTDGGPRTPAISPFLVVGDAARSVEFYCDKLGFSLAYAEPSEQPFFAIVYRDGAQIFLKSEDGVQTMPNNRRHPHLRWDAYVYTPDPDALYLDYQGRDAPFSQPLMDTHDGLRGFE